ncbi:MAG: PaaI family thioesterase [Kineosporiaceae bacterium]
MSQTQRAETPVRERRHSWQDPRPALAEAAGLDGLEIMRRIADGRLPFPPLAGTLGYSRFEAGPGRVVVGLDPEEFHYNPLGTVHGGVIATLLDTAAGCAVHTTLPAGTGYTTVDLHTRFLAPVRVATGPVLATGTVLHRGSRTATAEARLDDAGGRLLAHATAGCLLLSPAGTGR